MWRAFATMTGWIDTVGLDRAERGRRTQPDLAVNIPARPEPVEGQLSGRVVA